MIIQKYGFILSSGIISFYFFLNLLKIWSAQKKWIKNLWNDRKTHEAMIQHLPSLLLQLSSFLQAGHALSSALKQLGNSKYGQVLYQKIHHPTENMSSTEILFLKTCLTLSLRNGISLSPLFKNLSQMIQTQIHIKEKIELTTFPLKAQAAIAMILPWLTLFVFGCMAPTLITQALNSPWGVVGFSTALILEIVAFFWIKRILQ